MPMDDSLEKVQEIINLLNSLDPDALKRIPRDVLIDFSGATSNWSHLAWQEIVKGYAPIGPCPNGITAEDAQRRKEYMRTLDKINRRRERDKQKG
jgi:hypothetical protein